MKQLVTNAVLANAAQIAVTVTDDLVGHEIARSGINETEFFLKQLKNFIDMQQEKRNVKA